MKTSKSVIRPEGKRVNIWGSALTGNELNPYTRTDRKASKSVNRPDHENVKSAPI